MTEIRLVFTEQDTIRFFSNRGLSVLERSLIGYDGEKAFSYKQWQVMNPFTCEWEPVEAAFRRIAGKASEEQLTERMMKMNLNECFINNGL